MVSQIVRTIREIPQPVITMLRGVAVGAGSNLALASDFVIAADSARFCEIFINIGAIVDYGGHYFLPRLVGLAKARELAMLGNEIDGRTAAAMGLIYKSVTRGGPGERSRRPGEPAAAKVRICTGLD